MAKDINNSTALHLLEADKHFQALMELIDNSTDPYWVQVQVLLARAMMHGHTHRKSSIVRVLTRVFAEPVDLERTPSHVESRLRATSLWDRCNEQWWLVVVLHEEWARRIARASYHGHPHLDDLESEAVLYLHRVAVRFDLSRGVRFRTYAAYEIRSCLRAYMENLYKTPTASLEAQAIVRDESPEGNAANTIEQREERRDRDAAIDLRYASIHSVLQSLSQRKQHICRLILEGQSQTAVAAQIPISYSTVRTTWGEFKTLCRQRLEVLKTRRQEAPAPAI